jgi:hypothetical protein
VSVSHSVIQGCLVSSSWADGCMKKTWKFKSRQLFIKLCESRYQANLERAASEHAARIGGILKTATVHRQISRILIFELIPGPLLEEQPEEVWVSKALQVLASIHSTPIPEDVMNHYHGESLRNRLEQELEFIKEWPGISADKVDVIHNSINRPELSRTKLQEVPPVLGHGDYRGGNLVCTSAGEIIPVDWVDFGLCDPRYEWAHFLNSLDDVLESGSGADSFRELARQVLCPGADEVVFENNLLLGEIINRVIIAGSKARDVLAYGETKKRAAVFNAQVKRLESIL